MKVILLVAGKPHCWPHAMAQQGRPRNTRSPNILKDARAPSPLRD